MQSGVWFRMGNGIAFGFLAVGSVLIFPSSANFGSIKYSTNLFYCLCESRDILLARRSKRTFIRMLDSIIMSTTVMGGMTILSEEVILPDMESKGGRESFLPWVCGIKDYYLLMTMQRYKNIRKSANL